MLPHLTFLRRSAISASSRHCRSLARREKSTSGALPDGPARTRFAPSPTGYLHLGSLRTALFNYLLARKTGGQFLLRIEDTDQKRTVADAEQRLCDDLRWAGLEWDEGPDMECKLGPYRQSERTSLYQEHAQKLLDSGNAYRCFCPTHRLETLAKQRLALGLPTDYDRQCAGISMEESNGRAQGGEEYVVRLLAPELYPEFHDLVYGKVGRDKGEHAGITMKYGQIAYEDPVLLKSDGTPTYHLANVVDDHSMQITHVVRATEWMPSTPKHLELYKAFGWEPPKFAHVGLLVDEDSRKLSKRKFDTNVQSFRNIGILPSALVNFVALLGWSHSLRSDVMDLQELIDQFSMKFTRGNTTVSLEKLWYLQRAHMARNTQNESSELEATVEKTSAAVKKAFSVTESPAGNSLGPYVREIVCADSRNYTTPQAFCDRNANFFLKPVWTPFKNDTPEIARTPSLRKATKSLLWTPANKWNADELSSKMKSLISEGARSVPDAQLSNSKEKEKAYNRLFCEYLRWILLAGRQGPTLVSTMTILGKDVCNKRMEQAVSYSFRPD